ncbi:MAG TPA: M56 family metallopeptidase [Tepidisphaeraceae bacterium]|jgi:beta-lactamase regulating signal transducer with metallopeptidase domain|nr:M56 family metallopeptidase [Tepidisphaeraceae bacterium]
MGLPSFLECVATLDRLAPVMLSTAARSVVVLGMAACAALAMRRASAAVRYWVWLLGFAGVLLLPVLSAALPAWRVLPNLQAREWRAPASERAALPVSSSSVLPVHDAVYQERAPLISDTPNAASPRSAAIMAPPAVQITSRAIAKSTGPTISSPGHLPWTAWLLLGWLAGSLMVLGHMVLGYLSLRSLRRRCARVCEGELHGLLERLGREFGVRRPVELLRSPLRTMPMTWGVLRSHLLLPDQAADWPHEQQRAVLLHELGHVKRWDCLTQLLVQLACAIYWFNPIAWFANRRMQVERERACDDLVLNFGAEASSYARHLLRSVSSAPSLRFVGAAVAMARRSTLEERLRAILDSQRSRRTPGVRASIAAALLLLAGLVPVAVTRAQQGAAQEPPTINALSGTPTTQPIGRAGRGGTRAGLRGFGDLPQPTPGTGPTCSFDATVYDVRMPADQIGRLDVDAFQQAAQSTDTFEKALAALGSVRPLFRTNQSVRLSGENVAIETQTPIITNTTTTANGHEVSSYSYYSTGAIFSIAGSPAGGMVELDLGIKLSSISDSPVTVGKGVKVPVIRSVTISNKGPVEPHKPFVVVSVDANSVDATGKAVAYIGRIIVGEPQMPARPTQGQ